MDTQTAREFLQHWIEQADDTQVVGFVVVLQMVIEQQRGVPRSARAIEKDNLDGFGPRIPAAESYAKQGTVSTALLTCGLVVDFEDQSIHATLAKHTLLPIRATAFPICCEGYCDADHDSIE